jgi:hypothetical protein
MPDQFYSPYGLAEQMVSSARGVAPASIADFAAGDGQLLKSALARWPDARIVACDLNASILGRLRRTQKKWAIGECDFLSPRSRAHCSALKGQEGAINLILLNPPFSCRGNRAWAVELGGRKLRCGLALAFVVTALPFMHPCGELIAVMPRGCLQTEKDKHAWMAVRRTHSVELLSSHGRSTFDGCFPHTVVLRISPLSRNGSSMVTTTDEAIQSLPWTGPRLAARIVRGNLPMHLASSPLDGGCVPLVHSTELGPKGPDLGKRWARPDFRQIRGPAVLLARVGLPRRESVCIYKKRTRILLSDCVFALLTRDQDEAKHLHRIILNNWQSVKAHYGGTCAPYLTLASLRDLLTGLGVDAAVHLPPPLFPHSQNFLQPGAGVVIPMLSRVIERFSTPRPRGGYIGWQFWPEWRVSRTDREDYVESLRRPLK